MQTRDSQARAATGAVTRELDRLRRKVQKLEAQVADLQEQLRDGRPTCSWCNGSGEGYVDGSSCRECKGKGVAW